MTDRPPERADRQGLHGARARSAARAILALFRDPKVASRVHFVAACRDGIYEAWGRRGLVRFRRAVDEGGRLVFPVVERIGEDPLADQDHRALATLAEETRAPGNLPAASPFAYERIAQLFDSPFAPDLVVSTVPAGYGTQPGQHGSLDVVHSRAPLVFSGPGVRPGWYDLAVREVDIAPTVCRVFGFPEIVGTDATGRESAGLYLARQDGRVLEEILDESGRPERAYVLVLDGLAHTEFWHLVGCRHPAVRNLARIVLRGARFRYGSVATFPSITWPSHATLVTGAWSGHHDIVNPAFYLREEGRSVFPQDEGVETERYLGPQVETLYEAFHRVLGRGAITASIHDPQGRGADHAVLERRRIGSREELKARTEEALRTVRPRWRRDGFDVVQREAVLDARGLAQAMVLFSDPSHPPPTLVVHEFALTDGAGHHYGPHSEGLREALEETDERIGRILDLLEQRRLLEGTLFVLTSDHGMATQEIDPTGHPATHVLRAGIRAVCHEPMLWLRDLDVTLETRAKRLRVRVRDADRPERPVPGATVRGRIRGGPEFAGVTGGDGLAELRLPLPAPPEAVEVEVEHPEYNPYRSEPEAPPEEILYGR
ncbi:MAG: hypothetical protein KatS3mg076_1592 [Candidatus Binatia bacterium]|nr:MAG: hypothetical protein KatS3mg076_1592 [Candidatus Binatia bacterium]